MKKTIAVSFSGIAAALSVILLSLGSVVWVFSYVMPIATGLFMIIISDIFGKRSALLTYSVVSVLSVILLTDKESALMYICFFGYYPIIKDKFDRINPKALQYILKILVFNTAVVSVELICIYIFMIPFESFFGRWGAIILLALGNLLFFIYEKLITALSILYKNRLKNRITKYLQ